MLPRCTARPLSLPPPSARGQPRSTHARRSPTGPRTPTRRTHPTNGTYPRGRRPLASGACLLPPGAHQQRARLGSARGVRLRGRLQRLRRRARGLQLLQRRGGQRPGGGAAGAHRCGRGHGGGAAWGGDREGRSGNGCCRPVHGGGYVHDGKSGLCSSRVPQGASCAPQQQRWKRVRRRGRQGWSRCVCGRAGQIATSTGEFDSSNLTEEELRKPLTAGELRELIFTKYGKSYDISFVRRDFPGKTFVRRVRVWALSWSGRYAARGVALLIARLWELRPDVSVAALCTRSMNVMWNHLEQRSFKMTEEQYLVRGAAGPRASATHRTAQPARRQRELKQSILAMLSIPMALSTSGQAGRRRVPCRGAGPDGQGARLSARARALAARAASPSRARHRHQPAVHGPGHGRGARVLWAGVPVGRQSRGEGAGRAGEGGRERGVSRAAEQRGTEETDAGESMERRFS